MIETNIIQLVCVAICGINCGVSIMLTRDTVIKWREAADALKAAQTMLKLAKFTQDINPENTDLTFEEK